jgi:RNA polymerase sigma-70 factor (ECF subfamily)
VSPRHLDDESIDDVASSLHITRNNATVRLHRARAVLRDRLMHVCGAHSVLDCLNCNCDDV